MKLNTVCVACVCFNAKKRTFFPQCLQSLRTEVRILNSLTQKQTVCRWEICSVAHVKSVCGYLFLARSFTLNTPIWSKLETIICRVSCIFQKQSALFLWFKVRIPSVFSAVLQISDYGSQLWGCACLTRMCSDRNACYWWENWFCWLKNPRDDSENWVCPASTQHPHTHVNTLAFPRTLVKISSSCRNKSSPSWRPCVNVQLRVLFFFSEVMRRWDENENKNKRWAYLKVIPPSKKQCWIVKVQIQE